MINSSTAETNLQANPIVQSWMSMPVVGLCNFPSFAVAAVAAFAPSGEQVSCTDDDKFR